MFKELNVFYDAIVRQKKINDFYGLALSTSFDLGLDLEDLIKEIQAIDRQLKEVDVEKKVIKKVE